MRSQPVQWDAPSSRIGHERRHGLGKYLCFLGIGLSDEKEALALG